MNEHIQYAGKDNIMVKSQQVTSSVTVIDNKVNVGDRCMRDLHKTFNSTL